MLAAVLTSIVFRFLLYSCYVCGQVVPIENNIAVDPKIECLSSNVNIRFLTKTAFQGHLYVMGHYGDAECHQDYAMNKELDASLSLPFGKCGMRRQRKTSPKGLSLSTTVVVTFHRTFVTKADRAYHVSCFYQEDERTVTQTIDVSALPTADLDQNPPMPTCRYDVLAGGPEGPPVKYARVGDKVFHKWSCSEDPHEMYCMIIHSCTVDDGNENDVHEVVDRDGCAKDPVLMETPTYISDLMIGTVAEVFKFADKPQVFFWCQVSLSLKREHGIRCPKPECNTQTNRFRYRRSDMPPYFGIRSEDMDLLAAPLLVFDIDDKLPLATANSSTTETSSWKSFTATNVDVQSPSLCFSHTSFGVILALISFASILSVMFTLIVCLRHRSKDL